MQHRKSLKGSQPVYDRGAKQWLSNSKIIRAIAILGLAAAAIMFITLTRHAIITAQAQQASKDVAHDPSSFAANPEDANKQETKQTTIEQPDNSTASKNAESAIQGGSPCGWTSGAMYPVTIRDNAVTGIGNTLYSFGGANAAFLTNSYKFDGTTWTPIAPLPAALLKASAVTDGTSAYIVNGIVVGATANSVNTLYRYNPATNDYTTLAPSPTATWTQPAVFLNGKIYKIGGFNTVSGASTASNAVEVYDIASNTWSSAANYPLSIAWAAAWAQNGFVYVAGGTGLAAGSESLKTYRYDPATNTWDDAAIADLPASRWGAAFANYNGGLVLAGGSVAGVVSNTVIQWDSASNTWISLPNMLQPRFRTAGGVANGAFYVVGGGTAADSFTGTNDNQRLFCPPLTDPFITGAVTYVSENGTPVNNVPDPGETVTVSLDLRNIGGGSSGSVTATLQSTGGITPVTTSQNYGVLTAGGPTVSRNFTFTVPAGAACGSTITLTFAVTDGTTTTNVTKTYTLGTTQTGTEQVFSNTAAITINDNAPATPYPSTINVSGVTGFVSTIKVELDGFTHTFPADVDVLLVGPGGQKMIILSDVGGGDDVTNINVTLSDAAANPLPAAALTTGEYKPGNAGADDPFAAPAPAGPYANPAPAGTATFASAFGGSTPNGAWNLYVVDDAGQDMGAFSGGWKLTLQPGTFVCSTVTTTPTNSRADFDGDGKTDVSVFRDGNWFVQRSTAGFVSVSWGSTGDVIVPGDYDGDNKTDYAIYRPMAAAGAADFYVLNSATSTFTGVEWGTTGDVAKVGDFDGDNKDDFAVYRSSDNTWYILPSGGGAPSSFMVGTTGGTPVVLDYDGDAKTDIAMWDSSTGTWTIRQSSDSTIVTTQWGQTGDKLVPADYDGDNKDDLAVFRGDTWLIRLSSTGMLRSVVFGLATDTAVPGDYDGDGSDDVAVFRSGTWYINGSTSGFQSVGFGLASDIPVPTAYIP